MSNSLQFFFRCQWVISSIEWAQIIMSYRGFMFHLTPDTDQFAAFFRLIRSECEWPNGGAIAISGNENLVTLSAAIRKVRVGQNSAISDCVGTHLEVSHHQFHCLKWKSSESYCRACKLELSLESRVDWLRKNNLSCVFYLDQHHWVANAGVCYLQVEDV